MDEDPPPLRDMSLLKAFEKVQEEHTRMIEDPAAKALAAIERMNVDYRRVTEDPAARALAAIERMNIDYRHVTEDPAVKALQAFENMDATLKRFRNLVVHLPAFDLEVRGLVSKLSEANTDDTDMPTLTVGSVIVPERPVEEGVLIRCTSFVWTSIVRNLKDDWEQAFQIPPRVWEEILAGAFKEAGFEEVILTPRSGDHGRDVIAVRKGIGSVRILGSVKAYKPGHLITKEEVHALMGVVAIDPNASKGMFATTSDFAPSS
jgi:hypothetical protein